MTKLLFALLALSCFTIAATSVIAAADPSTTQIQEAIYMDNTCTTLQRNRIYNHTSGECNNDWNLYVPSADNAYVYLYGYANGTNGCPIANITSILKLQVGVCGATMSDGFSKFTVFTAPNNPSLPTEFPPSDFDWQTQYLDVATSQEADTCDTGHMFSYATPTYTGLNVCYQEGADFSYHSFEDSDCLTWVYALYSDDSCTNVVSVHTQAIPHESCVHGMQVHQICHGIGIPYASFPTTLSVGYTQYDNNQCITNNQTRTIVSTDGGCYQGHSYTCGMINGTQMVTFNTYANMNCTGQIYATRHTPTDVCMQNDAADPGMIASSATCHAAPIGPTTSTSTGTVLSSSTGPAGGISSSSSSTGPMASSVELTRSVSVVAILVGMIIGLGTISMSF